MEAETQRAQFDSSMVMIRHLVKCATDDKLREHMARQLEREAVTVRGRREVRQPQDLVRP